MSSPLRPQVELLLSEARSCLSGINGEFSRLKCPESDAGKCILCPVLLSQMTFVIFCSSENNREFQTR